MGDKVQGILRKTPQTPRTTFQGQRPGDFEALLGSPTSRAAGVYFAAPENLPELLARATAKDAAHEKAAIFNELDGLVTHLRNQKGPALIEWLKLLEQNMSLLKPRMENFVLALLRIGWADQEESVVTAYREFLVSLVTAQTYYTKPVVKMLVCNMVGITASQSANLPGCSGVDLEALEEAVFRNTHLTLKGVLAVTPLAGKVALHQYLKECQPYYLNPDTRAHTNYVGNVLEVSKYAEDPAAILAVVIARLVQLDAHVDLDLLDEEEDEDDQADDGVVFPMDESAAREQTPSSSPHHVSTRSLDAAMCLVFKYVDDRLALLSGQASSKEAVRALYMEFLRVFEVHVLPAHATRHVQFGLFYLMSQRPGLLAPHFLDHLWRIFTSVNTPMVMRQYAVGYVASLVARANFIGVQLLMATLERLCGWIHAYIEESSAAPAAAAIDPLKAHGHFYSACQAVFYLMAFRHEDLLTSGNKRVMAFLRSLQLNSIVTCRLNPLKACLPHIVRNFATLARNYQLAYCETIIQRNNRMSVPTTFHSHQSGGTSAAAAAAGGSSAVGATVLETFFPFDPYKLKESRKYINPVYREYRGNDDDDDDDVHHSSSESESEGSEEDQMEDSLAELEHIAVSLKSPSSSSMMDFMMMGTSPGFKH